MNINIDRAKVLRGRRNKLKHRLDKLHDYSESHEGRVTAKSKLCFGAVLFLENTVRGGCLSNVMFRFGLMRKEFKIDDLRQNESVYQSFEEFLEGLMLRELLHNSRCFGATNSTR
jgi:hypothetical protein